MRDRWGELEGVVCTEELLVLHVDELLELETAVARSRFPEGFSAKEKDIVN